MRSKQELEEKIEKLKQDIENCRRGMQFNYDDCLNSIQHYKTQIQMLEWVLNEN